MLISVLSAIMYLMLSGIFIWPVGLRISVLSQLSYKCLFIKKKNYYLNLPQGCPFIYIYAFFSWHVKQHLMLVKKKGDTSGNISLGSEFSKKLFQQIYGGFLLGQCTANIKTETNHRILVCEPIRGVLLKGNIRQCSILSDIFLLTVVVLK